MDNESGNQLGDFLSDVSPHSVLKLESSVSPPSDVEQNYASYNHSNGDLSSTSQNLPTSGTNVDAKPRGSKWTPEDEAEVLEWTPLYLKAGKSFEDIAQALTKRRSAAAVKARWNKLAEGKEEFAHLLMRRKRSKTAMEEANDGPSSSTLAPAPEAARAAKTELIEASLQDDSKLSIFYSGYGSQVTERLPAPAPWDIDEDARLTSGVLLRREEDWERVRLEMQPSTRTAEELRERWFTATKSVNAAIQSRGMWTLPLPRIHAALALIPGFDQNGHLFLDSNRKWTPIPPVFNAPATDAMHSRTAHQAQLIAREAASTPSPRISRPASTAKTPVTASYEARASASVQLVNSIGAVGSSAKLQQPHPPQQTPNSATSLPSAEARASAVVATHAAVQPQTRPPHVTGGAIPPFINKPSPLAKSTVLSSDGVAQSWGGGVPSMSSGAVTAPTSSLKGAASDDAYEPRVLGSLPSISRSEPAPLRFQLPPLQEAQSPDFQLFSTTAGAANSAPVSISTPRAPIHFQPQPLPISFPPEQASSSQKPSTETPFHLRQGQASAEEAQKQLLSRVSGAVAGGSSFASAPPSLQRSASYSYDLFNNSIALANPVSTLPRTQSTPSLSFYSQSPSNIDKIVTASQRLAHPWTPTAPQSFQKPFKNLAPFSTLPIPAAPQFGAPHKASAANPEATLKGSKPSFTPRPRSTRAASQKAGNLMQKLVRESQEDEREELEEWRVRDAARSKAGQKATGSDISTTEVESKDKESGDGGGDGNDSDEDWDGGEWSPRPQRGGKKGSSASRSAEVLPKKRERARSGSSFSSALDTDEARTPAEGEQLGGVEEEEEETEEVGDEEERMVKKPRHDSLGKELDISAPVDAVQRKPKSSSPESA